MLLPFQGAIVAHRIPRALPWAEGTIGLSARLCLRSAAAGYKLAPQLGQFFLCYRCICFTSGTHSFASPNVFYSIPTTTKKADAQDSPPCTSAFAYTHSMKLLLHSVYLIILLSSFYYRRILSVVVHIKPC